MKSQKALLEVFNQTDSDTTEIWLHGPIRNPLPDETEEDVISLKDVRKKLNEITTDKIIVHLSSTGGNLFQSVAIHNMLKGHKAKIEVINDGVAASGGSVIAMAGDTIKFYSNSVMVIHTAHTITYGNAEEHREVARKLDQLDKSLKENYKDRFTGTDKELKELLQKEAWLTAEEAKERGFCDEIIDDNQEEDQPENRVNRSCFNRSERTEKLVDRLMKKYGGSSTNQNLLTKLNGGKK